MIKYIIFDLDDTLCDYQKAKSNAINKVNMALRGKKIALDSFWKEYNLIEPILYSQFIEGKISIEEYRMRRYSNIINKQFDNSEEIANELNGIYMENANKNIELFDDVIPLFDELDKKLIKRVVLTNGPSDGQRDKISELNLNYLVSNIYISEEIGYSKPSREAYEYVLNDLYCSLSEIIMVGDSIKYDYEGAKKIGMEAVLVDRSNIHKDFSGLKVSNMLELMSIL
ncbi:HAD family hydrolase [Clostridium beijerinckii]|uniref:HAD family hydrolase n=1 Tax=Clostridium TaxID=1485 RepID=UPI000B3F7570|nr:MULTISPECIES: HAD family hydrolase [Clostridium]NOW07509.1 putative hydrolase of the HAD superfamily [Clostridium beijerinckii]NYC04718.1 putative hydrolase of the HAD superfamily [Clostridium beijerinckii]OVE67262.1 hypothetical protein CCS79_14135 [Clostridium diolis]UYZ35679.1 HAD family hydrolase [Clostridium beijerinckii]